MADQREPDLSEDPRKKGVAQGYPEEHPGAEDAAAEGKYPDDAEHGGTTAEGPSTSHDADGGAGQATGNPDAAGA